MTYKGIGALVAIGLGILGAASTTGSLTGCGGCYINEHVANLAVNPDTACLGVTATAVNACDGAYQIQITNGCTTPFFVAGQSIDVGSSGRLSTSTGDTTFCQSSGCSVTGTLTGPPITISWTLAHN